MNECQVAGIQKAVPSLDRGDGVPHERVKKWSNPGTEKRATGKLPLDAIFGENYIGELTAIKPAFFDQIDATAQYLEWIAKQPPLQPPAPRAVGVAHNSHGRIILNRTMATRIVVRNRRR